MLRGPSVRERLIDMAATDSDWELGSADETWWKGEHGSSRRGGWAMCADKVPLQSRKSVWPNCLQKRAIIIFWNFSEIFKFILDKMFRPKKHGFRKGL
jgi:hypothetical protein